MSNKEKSTSSANYENRSKADLLKEARKIGIEGRRELDKKELAKRIRKYRELKDMNDDTV